MENKVGDKLNQGNGLQTTFLASSINWLQSQFSTQVDVRVGLLHLKSIHPLSYQTSSITQRVHELQKDLLSNLIHLKFTLPLQILFSKFLREGDSPVQGVQDVCPSRLPFHASPAIHKNPNWGTNPFTRPSYSLSRRTSLRDPKWTASMAKGPKAGCAAANWHACSVGLWP